MKFSYRYRKNVYLFRIICVLIIIAVVTLLLDAKLRPSITDLAALEAQAVAESRVNVAVEKYLSKHGIDYSDIVCVNFSSDNTVTGITTDIVKLNLFKAEITQAIKKEFERNALTTVTVPFGSATEISLLSGCGPFIDVEIAMASSTVSDFENIFQAAGVNQTQHSIMLNLKTTVLLTLSGRRITRTVDSSFCVAQTVIVGTVPNVVLQK